MEVKLIFKEIFGARSLVVKPIWNWINKWENYDKVIARKKYKVIKDTLDYEIVFSDFKESYIKDLFELGIEYDNGGGIRKMFEESDIFDGILFDIEVIVGGDKYKYNAEVKRREGKIFAFVKCY